MRRILLLTCIGSLALALTAWGAPKERKATRAKGKPAAHAVSAKGKTAVRSSGMARAQRSVARPHGKSKATVNRASVRSDRGRTVRKPSAVAKSKVRTSRDVASRNNVRASRDVAASRAEAARARSTRTATADRDRATLNRERSLARANAQQRSRTEAARIRNERIAQGTGAAARRNLAVNRQRNLTFARNVAVNRDRNVRIVNHWRNDRFRDARYTAFYNYNREWHDRDWWHGHCSRVVFALGGWWGWNAGYWYPAWGYDPYVSYSYDGPIYTGYDYIAPDQVIINVQFALRDWGYYAGATDGILGPQTRAALAAFQADNGLAVTSTVDQPTLQTLGVA